MPCWRSSRKAAGLPEANALASLVSFAARSAASAWSTATRTAAVASAGSGAVRGGVTPARACASAACTCAATSASSRPPSTSAPRSGALAVVAVVAVAAADGGLTTSEPGTSAAAKLRAGGRCRPGTCSSTTTWKLVPPNPNALTPPRRTSFSGASHGRRCVLTAKGRVSQSTLGFGFSKCRLGASCFSCSERTILNSPAEPAAALRWPMFDLTDPRAMERGAAPAAPKTAVRLASSEASPTRVEVPCASTAPAVAGSTPARCHARSTASCCPTGFGAVMPLPLPSEDPPTPRMTA